MTNCICEQPDYEGQAKSNGGWDKGCPVHGDPEPEGDFVGIGRNGSVSPKAAEAPGGQGQSNLGALLESSRNRVTCECDCHLMSGKAEHCSSCNDESRKAQISPTRTTLPKDMLLTKLRDFLLIVANEGANQIFLERNARELIADLEARAGLSSQEGK